MSITAEPYTGEWPTYTSGEQTLSYPTWSITGKSNHADYLLSLNGDSSSIKAEKAFGTMEIVAHCGNIKKINAKFIRVKFAKKTIYTNWNIHNTLDVAQFLAKEGYGCADPSTCTDLNCNHHGCNDSSNFAWSVVGDAQLELDKGDRTTEYAQNFSPKAEAAKTESSQRLSFTGNIRFTKTSLTENATNITVTATSEELTSETDTLTVIPQYINLVVTGVEEETYDPESGELTNPTTNEGSIGAFVAINDNDSNDDKNVDREKDTESSSSDPDLLAVTLSKQISGTIDADHPVTLSLSPIYPATSFSMKVWKDAERSELYLEYTGPNAPEDKKSKEFTTVPGKVYVEAIDGTAAALTVSYSYSYSNDETNDEYSIVANDNMRLNGFSVDIDLAGLDDEKTVMDSSNPPNTVRVLPFEIFPGGELEVRPDVDTTLDENSQVAIANGILTNVDLKGSGLVRALSLGEGETNPDLEMPVTITSTSDKIKLYQSVMVEGVHQTNAIGIPLYEEFTDEGLKVADLPKTIYILPIKDSESKRDVELKMSYISPQNGVTHEDVIKLTCLMLDVDVDSNNDGTVAVDDATEDSTELYAPITVNGDDKDGDGIADNVDYHISSSNYSENIFKEMVVRLPKSIDLDNCKIKISYSAAVPPLIEGGILNADGDHSLRIWKNRSNEVRGPNPIGGTNQTGDVGGDYVMPTNWTVAEGEEAYYTPEQLLGEGSRQCSFWIESVCEANGYNAQMTVTILPIEVRTVENTVIPDDEATVPETYNLSDTVGFSTLGISLHFPNPIPATPAEGTTPASRGYDTILVTNIADESTDGKRPDYANFSERLGETSLLQLNMTISTGNITKDKLKIKFEYGGVDSLDSVTETSISVAALKDIFMRGDKQYFDYTPFKKGMMRVWASSKPVQDAGGTWSSATTISATSARDRATYIDGGNYFIPTTSAEGAYSLSDLFPDSNGPNYSMSFHVEGINPSEKTPIKAILLYNNGSSWQEVAASFVNVKVMEAKVILNVDNDKDYKLDDNDHKMKDQHDGFQGWYAAEFNSSTLEDTTSTHGFENLFPILLKDLPKLPENMKYELQINHSGVVSLNPGTAVSRLAYLKEASSASSLKTTLTSTAAQTYSVETHIADSDLEFLFGVYQTETTANNRVSLVLYPDKINSPTSYLVLDECLYTFRPVDKYFMFGSCRDRSNTKLAYPLDGEDPINGVTYTEEITPYNDVTFDTSNFAARDSNLDKYFVFLHGYNVDLSAAQEWNRVVFRRIYWSGYRGNHLGITWHGNEGQIPGFNSPLFWTNTRNALHSSYAVSNLFNTIHNWGVSSNDVSIMAHSLGNVVMWDALRVYAATKSGQAVKTAISAQGAVWEEAFYPQNAIVYLGEPVNNITYSEADLITHSWAFWFRQTGKLASNAVGTAYNSHNSVDEALDMMITSDYILKDSSIDFPTDFGDNHYNRTDVTNISPTNRTSGKLANYIPALLHRRVSNYSSADLNLPIGLSDSSKMTGFSSFSAAWPADNDETYHSSLKNVPLYKIYPWYSKITTYIE